MSRIHTRRRAARPLDFVTDFAKKDEETLTIPAELGDLSDEALAELATKARDAFTQLNEQGSTDGYSDETLNALEALADGIERLDTETGSRETAAAERAEKAAALAARVNPADDSTDEAENSDGADGDSDDDDDDSEDDEAESDEDGDDSEEGQPEGEASTEEEQPADEQEREAVTAAAAPKRATRVNLSGLRSRQGTRREPAPAPQRTSLVAAAAPDVPNFSNGQELDLLGMGQAFASRLATFNERSYANARLAGRHLRQQYGVAVLRKDYRGLLADGSNDDEMVDRAADESQLEGGSLVASGGWCAPSEQLYDLFDEGASREGIFTLPEVGIARAGIRYTKGPTFQDIYASTGFSYTEEQDEAGTYGVDANGVGDGSEGSKPCFRVECEEFEEERLDVAGLCITAGLLQRRAYPELIAKTVQLALIAHDHRMAAKKLTRIAAGSDAVSMPAGQIGALAPLLSGIELQVQHYRYVHRLPQAATLEAVFPFWVRGVVRSDLSRRLGVDLIDVPDSRVNAWFTSRGVNPQFVYNWQDITGAAAGFTAWPTSVEFLLYRAGTWVGGGTEVITLDTVYDSVQLGENDYTALFTEEGWLVVKRGFDSRRVTVPLNATGMTGAGLELAHNGTEVVTEAPAA